MKKYNHDGMLLSVVRCPADLYMIKNFETLQNATASKAVAQSFLDSWANKKHLPCMDDLDVDFYNRTDASACKWCISYSDGYCRRLSKWITKNGQ